MPNRDRSAFTGRPPSRSQATGTLPVTHRRPVEVLELSLWRDDAEWTNWYRAEELTVRTPVVPSAVPPEVVEATLLPAVNDLTEQRQHG
ncbi:hypothetical protein OG413_27790 [Streptomyces sp. NBC_01433]|uniref:hypothetical protein n=1 Tax=Streptomyces sp. NBC_01433 TaxID=2903864 RepID=UPI0022547825|nr:hypothetical protein [Streptomyces sp. NBC_01433]MCX4679065.1 hypothetical protein [Streptomyces sp. NBC_01433]